MESQGELLLSTTGGHDQGHTEACSELGFWQEGVDFTGLTSAPSRPFLWASPLPTPQP